MQSGEKRNKDVSPFDTYWSVITILSVAEYQLLMRERELRAEWLKKFESAAQRVSQEVERNGLSEES